MMNTQLVNKINRMAAQERDQQYYKRDRCQKAAALFYTGVAVALLVLLTYQVT